MAIVEVNIAEGRADSPALNPATLAATYRGSSSETLAERHRVDELRQRQRVGVHQRDRKTSKIARPPVGAPAIEDHEGENYTPPPNVIDGSCLLDVTNARGGAKVEGAGPDGKIVVKIDGVEYIVDPKLPWSLRGPLRITGLHKQIMYALLDSKTQKEIAEEFGLDRSSLSIVCRSPLFVAELRKLEKKIEDNVTDVGRRFRNIGPKAFNAIAEMIEAEGAPKHSAVRLQAADKALLYGGFKPAEKKEVHHTFEEQHLSNVQEAWRRRQAGIKNVTPPAEQLAQAAKAVEAHEETAVPPAGLPSQGGSADSRGDLSEVVPPGSASALFAGSDPAVGAFEDDEETIEMVVARDENGEIALTAAQIGDLGDYNLNSDDPNRWPDGISRADGLNRDERGWIPDSRDSGASEPGDPACAAAGLNRAAVHTAPVQGVFADSMVDDADIAETFGSATE